MLPVGGDTVEGIAVKWREKKEKVNFTGVAARLRGASELNGRGPKIVRRKVEEREGTEREKTTRQSQNRCHAWRFLH